MSQFVVAEINKNWIDGKSISPLLNTQFETVIDVNFKRGYRLHSFQIHKLMVEPNYMMETLIAVFERIEGKP